MSIKRQRIQKIIKGHFKTILSFMIIVSILSTSLFSFSSFASSASSWAENDIANIKGIGAYTDKLMSSYQDSITRAEFAELIVLTYKAITGEFNIEALIENPFVDTSADYVIEAFTLGLVNGTDLTHFSPDNLITREQMISIFIRLSQLIESKLNIQILSNEPLAFEFNDANDISSWAYDSLTIAYNNAIISGIGDGRIGPKGNTSREQALIVNYRLISKIVVSEGYDKDWEENFLLLKRQVGIVTCEVLNVRSSPSLDSDDNIVYKLQQYNQVNIEPNVMDMPDEWYYITTDGGVTGYVYREFIRIIETFEEDTALGEAIKNYAMTFLGTPYQYGGSTKGVGMDCAGFTQAVMVEFGYHLSRSSAGQSKDGIAIDGNDLRIGDLVVYGYSGVVSHVALYIGNGQVIHATTSRGVVITDVYGYMYKPVIGFRRVIQ